MFLRGDRSDRGKGPSHPPAERPEGAANPPLFSLVKVLAKNPRPQSSQPPRRHKRPRPHHNNNSTTSHPGVSLALRKWPFGGIPHQGRSRRDTHTHTVTQVHTRYKELNNYTHTWPRPTTPAPSPFLPSFRCRTSEAQSPARP